jgi:hypothetical protein
MFIPGQIICDFCKGGIDPDLPFPKVILPLTLNLRKKIQAAMTAQAIASFGDNVSPEAQPHIIVPLGVVPETFEIEVCQGCIDGFFSGVQNVLEEQVIYAINQKVKHTEKKQRAGLKVSMNDD